MATPPRTGGTSATGGYATTGGCRFPVVRPCVEGPAAPGPTPSTLVRPVVATALPAGGPHAAGRMPPFLAAAAASGAVSHPALARVYDAAVEDRPDGQAHLAHVIRLGDVLGGSAGQRPAGDAAAAAATSSTAAAPVMQPGECSVRSVDKPTTRRHGPHRVAQQRRPSSPREARQGLSYGRANTA